MEEMVRKEEKSAGRFMNHKLNRLSEINSNQGVKFSHSMAEPGSHCPMHTALAVTQKVKGVSSLVVGMPECGFYSRYVMDQPMGEHGELHYVYVLDSNEVVFGCREGLQEALKVMIQDGAKAIMVIMTCIPALIGEDIKEITEEFSAETSGKAVCIDMAHFKRNGYEAGFYEVYQALLSLQPDNRIRNTHQVNLLGSLLGSEGVRLREILTRNGFQIVELGGGFSIDDMGAVTAGRLNIVISIHMLPLTRSLEKEYGIPYIFLGAGYSADAITELYQSIFDLLEIEESVTQFQAYDNVQSLLQEKADNLNNIPYVATAVIPDILGVCAFLGSLSMRPLLLHVEEYNEWMKEWKSEILALGQNPYTAYITKREYMAQLLEQIDSDNLPLLSLGFLQGVPGCCVVGDREVRQFGSLIGYERTHQLLRIILHSLEGREDAAL